MKSFIVAIFLSISILLTSSPAVAFIDPGASADGSQGGLVGSIWDYYHGCAGAR